MRNVYLKLNVKYCAHGLVTICLEKRWLHDFPLVLYMPGVRIHYQFDAIAVTLRSLNSILVKGDRFENVHVNVDMLHALK